MKQSCLGAALQALNDTRAMQALIEDVCVPGGSTEKAVRILDEGNLRGTVAAAVKESIAANRAMRGE